ncbi:hypothetical protein [Pontibacter harenae]|uniref:hypothetical protein n=1 Tax=Pontibacter harenae TaxID=2894083 RepID=UPI001E47F785|nr:hypothetical protein [Pontibacter harenae]MCC9169167.1 hypothetical protein [Pontibacter harenae]
MLQNVTKRYGIKAVFFSLLLSQYCHNALGIGSALLFSLICGNSSQPLLFVIVCYNRLHAVTNRNEAARARTKGEACSLEKAVVGKAEVCLRRDARSVCLPKDSHLDARYHTDRL